MAEILNVAYVERETAALPSIAARTISEDEGQNEERDMLVDKTRGVAQDFLGPSREGK